MSSMWQHYALALIVLKAMLLAAMAAPTTTTTTATATWMTPTLTTKSKDGDADTASISASNNNNSNGDDTTAMPATETGTTTWEQSEADEAPEVTDAGAGAGAAATAAAAAVTVAARTLKEQQHVDCKLTFNLARNAATGQAQLAELTMGSLEQLLALHNNGRDRRCQIQLQWEGSSSSSNNNNNNNNNHYLVATTNKPVLVARPAAAAVATVPSKSQKHSAHKQQQLQQQQWVNSQPVYELQLVVWPDDIEDGDDVGNSVATTVEATATTTTTTTRKPVTTTNASPLLPLYEDQLVVFPQMDFEEENLDYFFDDLPVSVAQPAPAPTTGTTTTSTTTTTVKPLSTRPTIPAVAVAPSESLVYVLEDYHVVHPNGTAEYKLALSNGLVNYKKMYNKLVGDQVINVQEGYDSVPIPGREHEYQTQYYIADENGFNVYKIEHNYRVPVLPNYLHYKAKNVAAEATM